MKSIFSKYILAPAVLAAAALTAGSAFASTTVKIPFNFTADGKMCSAGDYIVQHEQNQAFVTLKHKGSSEVFTYVLGPGANDPNDTKVALNFDRLGGTHILQSIQYGSLMTTRLDKKSLRDAERESMRLTAGR
jgi:hypothetical protein